MKTYDFSTLGQVLSAWGQAFDSWGHLGGDGNAATISNGLGGFILGADATLSGRYRLGVAGGYTNSSLEAAARGSSGNVSATYIGLCGGVSADALQLRGGAFYAEDHDGLNRSVSFPGFDQTAGSGYGGDTLEPFGEAGWRIAVAAPMLSAAWVEPFIGVAGVDLHTASFSEMPGPAALISGSENTGYGITTLGPRGDTTLFGVAPLTLNAMIGWQHVYGGQPEDDACFREPSLNPVLDRWRADRARCAYSRTRRRPPPDLERQLRRLLFRTPVVERQRQRHQGEARGDLRAAKTFLPPGRSSDARQPHDVALEGAVRPTSSIKLRYFVALIRNSDYDPRRWRN